MLRVIYFMVPNCRHAASHLLYDAYEAIFQETRVPNSLEIGWLSRHDLIYVQINQWTRNKSASQITQFKTTTQVRWIPCRIVKDNYSLFLHDSRMLWLLCGISLKRKCQQVPTTYVNMEKYKKVSTTFLVVWDSKLLQLENKPASETNKCKAAVKDSILMTSLRQYLFLKRNLVRITSMNTCILLYKKGSLAQCISDQSTDILHKSCFCYQFHSFLVPTYPFLDLSF